MVLEARAVMLYGTAQRDRAEGGQKHSEDTRAFKK